MTQEEATQQAKSLLEGIHAIDLKVQWLVIPAGPMVDAATVDGYLNVLQDGLAAALIAADKAGYERGREQAMKE